MMDENRIYGQKSLIDTKQVQNFYDKRATTSASEDISAVLLGNQDPKFLSRRNTYDKEYIFPMLEIGPETRVLDIGCGIGRWAGFILPNCQFYCGVDFSSEMVRVATQVCQRCGGNFALHCMSALETVSQNADFYGGQFDVAIASGVLMYINDSDVMKIFQRIPRLMAKHCTIYSAEPVGLKERLTLNEFPSEALQTSYSAIYRTVEEYMELYTPLFENGFSVMKQEFRPKMGDHHSDTGRHHFILRR